MQISLDEIYDEREFPTVSSHVFSCVDGRQLRHSHRLLRFGSDMCDFAFPLESIVHYCGHEDKVSKTIIGKAWGSRRGRYIFLFVDDPFSPQNNGFPPHDTAT